MSEAVKRGRGRPPKSAKTPQPKETAEKKEENLETPSTPESGDRPGRRRAVPAKYRQDFVIEKVINITPQQKQEEESDPEAEEKETSEPGTPVDGRKKRGRPAGWRKYPEGKPEPPGKSGRPRGRPPGSLGKKNQAATSPVVTRTDKPQYYYLGDGKDKKVKDDPVEEEEEEDHEDDFNDISSEITPPPAKRVKQSSSDEEQETNHGTVVTIQATIESQPVQMTPPRPEPNMLDPATGEFCQTNDVSNEVSGEISHEVSYEASDEVSNEVSNEVSVEIPTSVSTSPGASTSTKPPGSGKRRLFVRTKDGKFLRLPDNAESKKLLTTAKLVLPSKPVPVTKPPVQLSLVGAQQVPESSLQMKKVSFSNVHRINDLCKVTPIRLGKSKNSASSVLVNKGNPIEVKKPKQVQSVPKPVVSTPNEFLDTTDTPVIDTEEMDMEVVEDESEPDAEQRPDAGTLLRSLLHAKSNKDNEVVETEDKGWNYEGSEPLAIKELLLYSLLHCQGALLNYTPIERSKDLGTIERVYNAMLLLDIPLPGDIEGLMDYLCTMDDLQASGSVGKIGSQRRWKYFFAEVQQTVNVAGTLLTQLLIQHWSRKQTFKLLAILKEFRARAVHRLSKTTPAPSGKFGRATSLEHVLSVLEARIQPVLRRWDVRYVPQPKMIAITRTLYNSVGGKLEVVTITLCILPSLLCEIRINNQKISFLDLGFSSFPGPLDHVNEVQNILEQIANGHMCYGFYKKDIRSINYKLIRGDKVYTNLARTGKPMGHVYGNKIRSENCTTIFIPKKQALIKTYPNPAMCGACQATQLKMLANIISKGKYRHPSICPDTGKPMIDLLKEERNLNTKLTRQVTRLKAGIAKFCMPGPYVDPNMNAASVGVEHGGYPGEVDSEEVVMATTTVQQQHQQQQHQGQDMSEVDVPLEHALLMMN